MIASERRRYMIEKLNEKGIINIKEIAKELEIAEITVRRDFEKLEKEGKLKRVLGGATLDESQPAPDDGAELTMKEKRMLCREEKARVAAAAMDFVQDGDNVFLDAGTSMVPLMRLLEKRSVNIVTYNQLLLPSINNPAADIFIVGGQYRPYYSMNAGPVAQDILRQFHFDEAFIGCSGVDLEQKVVYTTEMESLLMKRIALENADQAYLMIDSSKLNRRSFLKLTDLSGFSKVICDRPGQDGNTAYPENIIFV